MVKNHLKRIAAPKTWPIARKQNVFVAKSEAGKLQSLSVPLSFLLKEVLTVVSTRREVVVMLSAGRVKVDGVVRKNTRYPVGLFDVVELIDAKKCYRLCLNHRGKLEPVEVPAAEKDAKLLRVVGKTITRGGKMQISFLNGRTALIEDTSYKVGDSVIMNAEGKISKHLHFKPGMLVQFIGGRHTGSFGTIKSIEAQKLTVESEGNTFETHKRYAFVVGTTTQEVKVQ
jgi:small subunit ribosomal protein S4e